MYTSKLDARLERFRAVLQGLKRGGVLPAGITLVDSTEVTAALDPPLYPTDDEPRRDGGPWLDVSYAMYVHMRVLDMLEDMLGQGASVM